MERRVKERLIGAAVLLAAAIILIPEMLSGPKEEKPPVAQPMPASADSQIKSYSIDLNRTPSARAPAQTQTIETTPAPPPETSPAPQPAVAHDVPAPKPENTAPAAKPVEEKPAAEAVVKREPPTVVTPPVAHTESPPNKPKGGAQWAVQVGSFASKATAEKVAQSLKTDGYTAFVMPVTSGAATLYRVRVGPVSQRGDADALQRKLKPTVPQATVVAHP